MDHIYTDSGNPLKIVGKNDCFYNHVFYAGIYTRACIALASYRTAPYRSKQKAPKEYTLSEIEPVISSIAQGPAKNTIKID